MSKKKAPSLFFAPQSPYICTIVDQNDGDDKPDIAELAGQGLGLGCNPYERAAITRIIKDHERHFEEEEQSSSKINLSKLYRQAVADCLEGWSQEMDDKEGGDEESRENFEMLKNMSIIMHVSDVFLPLLVKHHDSWSGEDPYDTPGAATAATVRYLRYNHVPPAETLVSSSVDEMLESMHPEQFEDGTTYWTYLEGLVVRGCLEDAWRVLSAHSYYKITTAQDSSDDPFVNDKIRMMRDEFHALRDILLRAPLPAGRTDAFDQDLGEKAALPEETTEEVDYFLDDLYVSASDYQYWDTMSNETHLDNPAIQKHKIWRSYVEQKRHSLPIVRRIPQLGPIVAILVGDLSGAMFQSWGERLLAELLYCKPEVTPSRISVRARKIVPDFVPDGQLGNLEVLFDIMEGNPGQAIATMQELGGLSAAALPSTLTSLLFCLFVESGILESKWDGVKVEYLCESATAILSTFANTGLGTSLAVRLLAPYAVYEGNRRIAAFIAEIVNHSYPKTDVEAEELLDLCRPIVERKSLVLMESCSNLCLARYHAHLDDDQVTDATYHADGVRWLLTGIELESLVLSDVLSQAPCYRALAGSCIETAALVFKMYLREIEADAFIKDKCDSMVAGFRACSFDPSETPQAVVLFAAASLLDDSASIKSKAEKIIACLEATTNLETGIQSTIAPFSIHWHLLRVAYTLHKDTVEAEEEIDYANALFDLEGVQLLMERLLMVPKISPNGSSHFPNDQLQEMNAAFVQALARAHVAENSKRKEDLKPRVADEITSIRSANLAEYDIMMQERVVRSMLDV